MTIYFSMMVFFISTSFAQHLILQVELVMQSRWLMDGNRGTKLFYKSFSSMAVAKDIHKLMDSDGNVKNSWEDMSTLATDFFTNTLGDAPGAQIHAIDPRQMEEVMEVQSDRLSVAGKEELNAPITLEELGDSMNAMANGKCPGPDGTPIKFYKANWLTVGPLILACIINCIAEEHFPAFFTKGAIVLLKKKNDQCLLGNRRPITLLNFVYKMGAKVMQRHLSLIQSSEDYFSATVNVPPWP